jgi:hypothetical protein
MDGLDHVRWKTCAATTSVPQVREHFVGGETPTVLEDASDSIIIGATNKLEQRVVKPRRLQRSLSLPLFPHLQRLQETGGSFFALPRGHEGNSFVVPSARVVGVESYRPIKASDCFCSTV